MQISQEAAAEAARELLQVEHWLPFAEKGARVLVIVVAAALATRLTRRLLKGLRAHTLRQREQRGETSQSELEKRAATIVAALSKLAAILIWVIATIMSLHELAFNIEPILAGFGVAGLAVGLGAQALIKDWLGGLLILIEDQIRIGDGVTINGISGTVEEINLRTTILRGESGAVFIISNGLINTLSNMTRGYAYYLFQATIAYGSDVDRALKALTSVGEELAADPAFKNMILAPIEVSGVDRFSDRGIAIRARIRTTVAGQGSVGAELNRRVNLAFAKDGIAFAPPNAPARV
jgi:small conductance mechanosensitive channel